MTSAFVSTSFFERKTSFTVINICNVLQLSLINYSLNVAKCVTRIKSVILFTKILSYAIMTYFNRPLFHVLNSIMTYFNIPLFHVLNCS
jgi:hypothetical protein